MPFTIIFLVLAFFALSVIFGVTYKLKGGKTALLVTGVSFLLFAMLFVGIALTDTKEYQPDLIPGYAPAIEQRLQQQPATGH